MGTTADKLNKILESKAAIKSAIEAKGITDVGDVLANYPDKIASIQSGGSGFTGHADVEGLKAIGWTNEDIEYYQTHGVNWNEEDDIYHKVPQDNIDLYGVLTKDNIRNYKDRIVYLPKIDTSDLMEMNSMFAHCYSLVSIPLLDTSNVFFASFMFKNCYSLTSIPILDTSNLSEMVSMFENCYSLTSIPILDTSTASTIFGMFKNCYSLTSIPFLDVSEALLNGIFEKCYSLRHANIKGLREDLNVNATSLLSKESLLYIIENAAPTSAITITLSSYCYNKYSVDIDIVAALKAQPNISLASV